MAITIDRDVILTGPVTRFELDGTDLGPTLGSVIIRRETEHTEITTDTGGTVEQFRSRDQMFIEVELASGSLRNLEIAWGGQITQATHTDGTVTSRTLTLDRSNTLQQHHELIIEGTDKDSQFRRYVFRKVVSLAQTSQTISRDGIASIALEFEVLTEPLRPQRKFGEVIDLRIPAYTPGDAVPDDPVPTPSWTGTPKLSEDPPELPDRIATPPPPEPPDEDDDAVPPAAPPAMQGITIAPTEPKPEEPDIPDETTIEIEDTIADEPYVSGRPYISLSDVMPIMATTDPTDTIILVPY